MVPEKRLLTIGRERCYAQDYVTSSVVGWKSPRKEGKEKGLRVELEHLSPSLKKRKKSPSSSVVDDPRKGKEKEWPTKRPKTSFKRHPRRREPTPVD